MSVGIVYGEDGLGRSGRSEGAQFYLPIDGDLRGGVDASVLVTHELSGSDDQRMIKLSAIVENKGEVDAGVMEQVCAVSLLIDAPDMVECLIYL